jgi:hypothetical protein
MESMGSLIQTRDQCIVSIALEDITRTQRNQQSALCVNQDGIRIQLGKTYAQSATLVRGSLKQVNNFANGVTKASIKTKMGRNHANNAKLAGLVVHVAFHVKTVLKGGIAMTKKMGT